MGALHVAIARAPGWRIARVAAAVALPTAAYNIVKLTLSVGGFFPPLYIPAGKLTYVVITIHAVCWILYAYADSEGPLARVPNRVRLLVASAVALCAALALTSQFFSSGAESVNAGTANIRYRFPLPS